MSLVGFKAWVATPLGKGQIISEIPKRVVPKFTNENTSEDMMCHLVRFVTAHRIYGEQQWISETEITVLK